MKVLLISVGNLQAGYLGFYGNEWVATPNLDRLAAAAIVFDQHYADRPDIAGACHAWRTGRYLFCVAEEGPAGSCSTDLPSLCRTNGVPCTLVCDEARLPASFTAGWHHLFHWHLRAAEGQAAWDGALPIIRRAVENLGRERALLWLDLAVLGPPWQVPDEFQELYSGEDDELRQQQNYAGMVSYLDSGLGFLLENLQHELDDWLLILTADRGMPLGEHGIVGACRSWLHEELVHLPLLVRLPGQAEAGRRILALTQPVDLMPTIAEALGLPLPASGAREPAVHGHSLWPLCRGERERLRDYACGSLKSDRFSEWSIRTPEWAFLLPVQTPEAEPCVPQLYQKPDDRWEVNNLCQHHPELVERLEQTLRGFVSALDQPGVFQPPDLTGVEKGSDPLPTEGV
jgi:arylsulfatase A-like enzyme